MAGNTLIENVFAVPPIVRFVTTEFVVPLVEIANCRDEFVILKVPSIADGVPRVLVTLSEPLVILIVEAPPPATMVPAFTVPPLMFSVAVATPGGLNVRLGANCTAMTILLTVSVPPLIFIVPVTLSELAVPERAFAIWPALVKLSTSKEPADIVK